MKHANALESNNILIFIVMDLLQLATRNNVLGLKMGWDHFNCMMHQSLVSWSLLILDVFVSQIFKLKGVDKSGMGCVLHLFFWTVVSNVSQTSLSHDKWSSFIWMFIHHS
jgi:hypothetical protein